MSYRIGSGQGFYGDDVTKALAMIRGGHVDVVCFEALAELTLAILQKDRLQNPEMGYTFDIKIIAEQMLSEAFSRKIPLITNGGGLNPLGAAKLVKAQAEKMGLKGLKIAYVQGDNLLSRLDEFQLKHLYSDEVLDPSQWMIANANVYLGAKPIVEALEAGADMVITGRVADPCLYLAPLIQHYGWQWDDWDRLAAGIVAGHLLECTGQVVGGNSLALIDEIDAHDLNGLGYPIAEVEADGSFIIRKIENSPGILNINTVKEQLLYEIHDPENYITPDVIVDITHLSLEEVGKDQVRVSGVRGKERPEQLKLSMGRVEGYMRELIFTIGWPECHKKYEQLMVMLEDSIAGLGIQRVKSELLGQNSLYGAEIATTQADPMELIVRVVFTASDEGTLKKAVRNILANGLSGPAGMSLSGSSIGGKARIILGLFPTLIDREAIETELEIMEVGHD